MVHTFDIGMMFYERDDAIKLMRLFKFPSTSIGRFDIKDYAYRKMGRIRRGIKYFRMIKCKDKSNQCIGYSLTIRMEPWLFITQKESIDLFVCSSENVDELTALFREFMIQYVHETGYAHLADISVWNCRRIDYMHNFHFNDKREADTFYRLSKRTSFHRRTKEKRRRDRNKFDQSTAEANLSSKTMFYDKRAQIEADYAGMDEDDMDELMMSAENLIRYELQCYKGKISTIKRKYELSGRSILFFLNECIADDLLFKQYAASVGYGDFYELSRAKSRIMHYEGMLDKGRRITNGMRKKLFQFMQLVADARGLEKARKCFHDGRMIKNSNIFVHGSDSTFLSRVKDLTAIGINPVAIPRGGSKKNERGEIIDDYPKYLENPIHSW